MGFFARIMTIDRRIVYLIMAIAIVVPFFIPGKLPVPVTKEVKSVYNYIERLGPNDVILMSSDYSPSTKAELYPMVLALARHAFKRDVKVMMMTLRPRGIGLAERAVEDAADDFNKVRNKDYVFLGYKPGRRNLILGMGVNIHNQFPTDYYGTPIEDIPMMDDIRNYDDIALALSFSGSALVRSWLTHAHERFDQKIAWGITGVMAPDFYPFLQSGQVVGLMGGMKGAAEYEKLIDMPGRAIAGMNAQSAAHVMIIIFILIGNLGYFITGEKKI